MCSDLHADTRGEISDVTPISQRSIIISLSDLLGEEYHTDAAGREYRRSGGIIQIRLFVMMTF